MHSDMYTLLICRQHILKSAFSDLERLQCIIESFMTLLKVACPVHAWLLVVWLFVCVRRAYVTLASASSSRNLTMPCQANQKRFQIMKTLICDHVQQQDEVMLQPHGIWDFKMQAALILIAQ